MKIIRKKYDWLLLACLLLMLPHSGCHSQDLAAGEARVKTGNPVPYDLSLKEWNKVQKIWKRNSLPVVRLYNNELTHGQILFMNDTMLVLWADAVSFYNPYESDSLLRIIKGDSIGKIMAGRFVPRKFWDNGLFWFPLAGLEVGIRMLLMTGELQAMFVSVPIGFAVGGLVEMVARRGNYSISRETVDFSVNSDSIQRYYFFFRDELPGHVLETGISYGTEKGYTEQVTFDSLLEESALLRKVFWMPNFSVAGYIGTAFFTFHGAQMRTTAGASLRYGLSDKFFLGYSLRYAEAFWSEGYDPPLPYYREESYRKAGHTLFFKYAPLTVNRFLTKRIELTTGAGLSMNTVKWVENIYTSTDYYYSNSFNRDRKHYLAGLALMVDLGFYLAKEISLNLGAEKTFISPLEIEEKRINNSSTGQVYTLPSQKISPSSLDITVGLHLHF